MSPSSYLEIESEANGGFRSATLPSAPPSWPVHSDRDHDTHGDSDTYASIEFNSIQDRASIGVKTASSIGVTSEDSSSIGVKTEVSPSDDPISVVIARCVPCEGGTTEIGRCLFDLARGLSGLAPTADEKFLKECVARWVAVCRKAGIHVTGFDDAWASFKRKRETVRIPFGSRWRAVLRRSHDVVVPAGIGEKLAPVFRLFTAMDEAADFADEGLYVSFRDIGKATGLDHKTASRYVARLAALGHIELVQSGDMVRKRNAKANRYRFHNPPIPGGAPWNSDAKSGTDPQEPRESTQEPAREAPGVERPTRAPKPSRAVRSWSDPDAPPIELFGPPDLDVAAPLPDAPDPKCDPWTLPAPIPMPSRRRPR